MGASTHVVGAVSVIVTCVARGGWYPRGAARLINGMAEHCPGYEVRAHVNVKPFGAPASVIEGGYDYTAYCSKPYALLDAMMADATIGILLDAAFYPIRHIGPLVDHIAQHGYYLCRNGNNVGEWSSDRCLEAMSVKREDAFKIEEVSSYCVGLNFRDSRCVELLRRWCDHAADRVTFPGTHTNWTTERLGRNRGFCSDDARVKGHRHDQTVLSILAHRLEMRELCNRPKFTAYLGSETEETVLVNQGLGS